MRFSVSAAILLIFGVSSLSADTIVLKNGRRIVAQNVTEDAEHVSYLTPAGQLSLPKSIVARIEHDDFTYSSESHNASEPPVSPPQIEPVRGYEDIVRLTVHDNAIDYSYLAQLESDARSGSQIPVEK